MLRMHELTAADGRPGPHVILMSSTSYRNSDVAKEPGLDTEARLADACRREL